MQKRCTTHKWKKILTEKNALAKLKHWKGKRLSCVLFSNLIIITHTQEDVMLWRMRKSSSLNNNNKQFVLLQSRVQRYVSTIVMQRYIYNTKVVNMQYLLVANWSNWLDSFVKNIQVYRGLKSNFYLKKVQWY